MDLNITPTAAARFPEGHDLYILTSNDGSNQFSSAAGCCMIGERFLITPIDEPLDPYNELVSSNQFTFFTSTYDQMFLTGHLILDVHPTSGTLILKNEGGYLDTNLLLESSPQLKQTNA